MKNVAYTYPLANEAILRNVNLEINCGEFVGLIGLTGTGKTTLLRLMNGLIPHYFGGQLEGEIIIDNLNTREHAVGELAAHVGMVFQEADSQLFFQTIEDDVAFGSENLCVPSDEIVQRVNETLEKAGLTSLRYKSPINLSEGQKQLVVISAVLAMKPKILLLDEPTSNLDSENSERVIELINDLNHEGTTVILATHEIDMLAECATRIVVVNDGSIQENGDPSEVFSKPDFFQKLGLMPPQVTQLAQKLHNDHHIDLEKYPVTLAQAFQLITRRLNA